MSHFTNVDIKLFRLLLEELFQEEKKNKNQANMRSLLLMKAVLGEKMPKEDIGCLSLDDLKKYFVFPQVFKMMVDNDGSVIDGYVGILMPQLLSLEHLKSLLEKAKNQPEMLNLIFKTIENNKSIRESFCKDKKLMYLIVDYSNNEIMRKFIQDSPEEDVLLAVFKYAIEKEDKVMARFMIDKLFAVENFAVENIDILLKQDGIFKAATQKDPRIAKEILVKLYENPNPKCASKMRNEYKNSIMDNVLISGDIKVFTWLYEQNIIAKDDLPDLFYLAAKNGHTGICEFILGKAEESAIIINEKNKKSMHTPLQAAMMAGHEKTALYILGELGVNDSNASVLDDPPILHIAAKKGMVTLTDKLPLSAWRKANKVCGIASYNGTFLNHAIKYNNYAMVKKCIEKCKKLGDGDLSLYKKVLFGCIDSSDQSGIKIQADAEETPLMQIMQILHMKKTDENYTDLKEAANYMIKELNNIDDKDYDAFISGSKGKLNYFKSCLHAAITTGKFELVETLLDVMPGVELLTDKIYNEEMLLDLLMDVLGKNEGSFDCLIKVIDRVSQYLPETEQLKLLTGSIKSMFHESVVLNEISGIEKVWEHIFVKYPEVLYVKDKEGNNLLQIIMQVRNKRYVNVLGEAKVNATMEKLMEVVLECSEKLTDDGFLDFLYAENAEHESTLLMIFGKKDFVLLNKLFDELKKRKIGFPPLDRHGRQMTVFKYHLQQLTILDYIGGAGGSKDKVGYKFSKALIDKMDINSLLAEDVSVDAMKRNIMTKLRGPNVEDNKKFIAEITQGIVISRCLDELKNAIKQNDKEMMIKILKYFGDNKLDLSDEYRNEYKKILKDIISNEDASTLDILVDFLENANKEFLSSILPSILPTVALKDQSEKKFKLLFEYCPVKDFFVNRGADSNVYTRVFDAISKKEEPIRKECFVFMFNKFSAYYESSNDMDLKLNIIKCMKKMLKKCDDYPDLQKSIEEFFKKSAFAEKNNLLIKQHLSDYQTKRFKIIHECDEKLIDNKFLFDLGQKSQRYAVGKCLEYIKDRELDSKGLASLVNDQYAAYSFLQLLIKPKDWPGWRDDNSYTSKKDAWERQVSKEINKLTPAVVEGILNSKLPNGESFLKFVFDGKYFYHVYNSPILLSLLNKLSSEKVDEYFKDNFSRMAGVIDTRENFDAFIKLFKPMLTSKFAFSGSTQRVQLLNRKTSNGQKTVFDDFIDKIDEKSDSKYVREIFADFTLGELGELCSASILTKLKKLDEECYGTVIVRLKQLMFYDAGVSAQQSLRVTDLFLDVIDRDKKRAADMLSEVMPHMNTREVRAIISKNQDVLPDVILKLENSISQKKLYDVLKDEGLVRLAAYKTTDEEDKTKYNFWFPELRDKLFIRISQLTATEVKKLFDTLENDGKTVFSKLSEMQGGGQIIEAMMKVVIDEKYGKDGKDGKDENGFVGVKLGQLSSVKKKTYERLRSYHVKKVREAYSNSSGGGLMGTAVSGADLTEPKKGHAALGRSVKK